MFTVSANSHNILEGLHFKKFPPRPLIRKTHLKSIGGEFFCFPNLGGILKLGGLFKLLIKILRYHHKTKAKKMFLDKATTEIRNVTTKI